MVEDASLTFEVFGLLQGVMTMIDRETGSVWTHLDGKAIEGPMRGARMTIVPMPQMTRREWKDSHPDTMALSQDTPFLSRYRPVRIGVFNSREAQFGDGRLAANALVVGVEVNEQFRGYPVEELGVEGGVVNDVLAAQPIVVVYDDDSQTGLAYSRLLDDDVLEFYNASPPGFELRDRETGSLWDHQGRAVSGPLTGESLEFLPSFISEWYGWSGYHPETSLFEASR